MRAWQGPKLLLQKDKDGKVQLQGAHQLPIDSKDAMVQALEAAKKRRATHATGANATSSRSHAVCRLTLPPQRTARGQRGRPAVLVLVDCAGSERKEDSVHHTAERCRHPSNRAPPLPQATPLPRQGPSAFAERARARCRRKEGAEINQSLHALKECMRQWIAVQDGARNLQVPYRNSALTRVLEESFTRKDTLMAVVGTLSPASADAEHSISTLKTICAIASHQGRVRETKEDVSAVAMA